MTALNIARFLHLFSLVVWQGSIIFFSFFAAPAIFKSLPKEEAGDVVGRIFPRYWAMGYICSVISLVSLIYLCYLADIFLKKRLTLLVIMTIITFYSGLYIGKKARVLKAEMRVAGPGGAKDALRKRFKKIHAISASLNMLVFVLGVFLIYFTSMNLLP